MANKLKKEHGQPEISGYLNGGDEHNYNMNLKTRTPPSIEKNRNKRKLTDKECPNGNNMSKLNESGNSDYDSDSSDNEVTHEETAFEHRLTKTLSKLMKKELSTVKKDIKALRTDQEKNIKMISDLATIREENIILKKQCERVLDENKVLKDRITKIENTLLDNNILLHGMSEDPWELESNRLEKVIKAISYTIDEDTREAQLEVARKIRIKHTKRIETYSSKCNHPISLSLEQYCDAEYILMNKKYLPKGVYADKEYTTETENNRCVLRPILKAA